MEKDTVLLSIDKYNDLKEFKTQIEEGKTLTIISSGREFFSQRKYITTEKAIKEIAEANKLLQEENEDLRNERQKIKKTLINDFKKMSYWEFRKWKKSN